MSTLKQRASEAFLALSPSRNGSEIWVSIQIILHSLLTQASSDDYLFISNGSGSLPRELLFAPLSHLVDKESQHLP